MTDIFVLEPQWETTALENHGSFKTVKIDKQVWMAENYFLYKTAKSKVDRFSWIETQKKDFYPKGWRMPSVKDFERLISFAKANSCLGIDWMEGLCDVQDEWGFKAGNPGLFNYFWTSDQDMNNNEFAKAVIFKGNMIAIENVHKSEYIPVRLFKEAE